MATSVASSLGQLIYEAAEHAQSPISTDALATKEVASYIRSLSNLSLSDLRNQPHQLQAKSDALHVQLSELCISQTDAFIHIHQAEQRFAPALDSLASNLSNLIQTSIPNLQAAADAFLAQSQPALEQRKHIQNVADQYERGHLSDLLDIPPLVHTCVKAGHHSEAIQLAEHLIGLLDAPASPASSSQAIEHGQRSTYLSLLIETLAHLAVMKADLLAGFSKPSIKFPAVRKSVTVLRRLNHIQSSLTRIPDWTGIAASERFSGLIPKLGITENQLCLVFLKARIHSFRASLNAMGSPSTVNSHAYLRRYIDLWRQEMADTLGMAFPLFVDDPTSVQHSNEHADRDNMISPAYLLASFTTSGLDLLRRTVSAQLKAAAQRLSASASVQGDSSASLEAFAEMCSNVHTQLSYASAALARFGLDFGELLFSPVHSTNQALSSMEAIWLDVLSRSLDQAFSYIHEQLDLHTSASTDALPSQWLLSSQLSSTAVQGLFTVSGSDSGPSGYDDFARPNIELVDYPPFAKLLNRLMEWINALQIFAPASLATPLLQRLDAHFSRVTERILAEIPQTITTARADAAHTTRLLGDDDAKSVLQHLDPEAKMEFEKALIGDSESAILVKALRMWNASAVQWVLHVVQSCFSDDDSQTQARYEQIEMKAAWTKAHDWIQSTEARVVEHNIKRKNDAEARKIAVEQAAAEAKAKAEVEAKAKAKAEEEARLKAEEEAKAKAEAEAKAKAEAEAKAKAEAEAKAKVKAEEEARLKAEAEAEAKAKAEAEAKAKAEEEARLKAEAEAKAKAEAQAAAEAKAKAEAEAKAKAEEQARLKAEAEAAAAAAAKAAEAEAKAKAKAEAQAKAEAEAKVKAEAEAEAKAKAEAEAEAKAKAEAAAEAERARIEREEEAAAKVKSEAEAKLKAEEEAAAKAKAEEEAAAKAKAEAEAESARVESDKAAAAKAEADARAKVDEESEAEGARVAVQPEVRETESQTQDETDTGAEQAQRSQRSGDDESKPVEAAAPTKKFSLAEKLRQRKEERDRAAAAAAAAAATSSSQIRTSQEQAKVDETDSSPHDVTAEEPSRTTQDEETKPDEAVEAAAAVAVDGGSSDVQDEAQDEDEEADSGTNTPTTPATPSTPNPANGPAKKSKKKKNKKKK